MHPFCNPAVGLLLSSNSLVVLYYFANNLDEVKMALSTSMD